MTQVATISQQIWDMKYRLKTANGDPVDKSIADTWHRVAKALAAQEKDPVHWEQRFFDAMDDFRFLPAGRIFSGAGANRNVTLFNCFVMGRVPDDMAGIFDTAVGLSDHTLGPETAIAAVTLGATLVEKHLTLRRADGGPDSGFSAEPEELATLCRSLRTAWSALGDADHGQMAVESDNAIFRRSLYAVADIAAGDALTRENIRSIRPGFGLPPKAYPDLLGRTARTAIARGTPLSWDLVV